MNGLAERRNEAALGLVELDNLLADLSDVGTSDAELLINLLVWSRRAPCGQTELLVAVLLPSSGRRSLE